MLCVYRERDYNSTCTKERKVWRKRKKTGERQGSVEIERNDQSGNLSHWQSVRRNAKRLRGQHESTCTNEKSGTIRKYKKAEREKKISNGLLFLCTRSGSFSFFFWTLSKKKKANNNKKSGHISIITGEEVSCRGGNQQQQQEKKGNVI